MEPPFKFYRLAAGILLILVTVSCERQEEPDHRTLEEKLNGLEGVSAISIEPVYGHPEQFRLGITQPVDHDNPEGATFVQRAYLHHAGEDLPVVFGPAGYGTGRNPDSRL